MFGKRGMGREKIRKYKRPKRKKKREREKNKEISKCDEKDTELRMISMSKAHPVRPYPPEAGKITAIDSTNVSVSQFKSLISLEKKNENCKTTKAHPVRPNNNNSKTTTTNSLNTYREEIDLDRRLSGTLVYLHLFCMRPQSLLLLSRDAIQSPTWIASTLPRLSSSFAINININYWSVTGLKQSNDPEPNTPRRHP